MKKLIKSISIGLIFPLIFFIVGKTSDKGNLKHTDHPDYPYAWAVILIVWVLSTIAAHTLILDRRDSKKEKQINQTNSG